MSEATVPGVSPEEQKARAESALLVEFENLMAQRERQRDEELRAELAALAQPDRSTAAAISHGSEPENVTEREASPHRGRLTLRSPYERVYSSMSEEERQWRSAESDHWVAEHFRGRLQKDVARVKLANAKIEQLYGRATLDEGTASSEGAISTGVGGDLIPRPLEQAVLIARDRVAKMRRFANNFVMTAQTHNIPTVNAATGYMTAESGTTTVGEPTPSNVQFTAVKGVVRMITTREFLEDAAGNVVSILAQRAGGALGALEDQQFWSVGNGTAPNISSKVDGTTAVTTATAGELNLVDVQAMYFAVQQEYRGNGAWYCATDVLQFLSGVVDSTARPYYQGLADAPGAVVDDPMQEGRLLRRPVYEVPLPDGVLIFGDMRAGYTVGTRQGITASMSEDVGFVTDTIQWKWTQRFDGNDVDAVALQRQSGITSAGVT